MVIYHFQKYSGNSILKVTQKREPNQSYKQTRRLRHFWIFKTIEGKFCASMRRQLKNAETFQGLNILTSIIFKINQNFFFLSNITPSSQTIRQQRARSCILDWHWLVTYPPSHGLHVRVFVATCGLSVCQVPGWVYNHLMSSVRSKCPDEADTVITTNTWLTLWLVLNWTLNHTENSL